MSPENTTPHGNNRALIIGLGVVVLVIAISFIVSTLYSQQEIVGHTAVIKTPGTTNVVPPPPPPSVGPSASFGGTIYNKTQNPIQDKLPAQSPIANPINDAYKNPFQ